ncbi:hypothetical protein GMORB2_2873 [Geosmithia morbida]|uniref:Uncharacterized protein n=1 Tax=Geosmithia morbida TaxID=1094350 RepID=A0A9P5CZF8_9HYPO|nr:uncharacterized protein GMORB2_2873 [Geosmithia morbida]KAF4120437.1 hypothetical protein GMORB2_2873 [Geosmithia morbida]
MAHLLPSNGGGVSGMHNGRVTRRPVPSLSAKSSERLRMEADAQAGPPAAVVVSSPEQPREIVVRDRHGEIEMGSPASPEMDDQGDSPLDSQKEADEESHRLVEAIKSHQMHSAGLQDHPDELLEAVKTSMRGKVARLSEDSWMYERGPGRGI